MGRTALNSLERGVKEVIGLDIQENRLKLAREEAARRGVSGKCVFTRSADCKADVVLSTDAFEHFERSGVDPKGNGISVETFGFRSG